MIHEQEIIDQIMSELDLTNGKVSVISLICSKDALQERLQKDVDAGIRTAETISRSLERISLYERLNTIKLDVSLLSPEQAAEKIAESANLSDK